MSSTDELYWKRCYQDPNSEFSLRRDSSSSYEIITYRDSGDYYATDHTIRLTRQDLYNLMVQIQDHLKEV